MPPITPVTPAATAAPSTTPVDEEPAPKEAASNVKTMFVDAQLVDCEGAGPMKCMRVRESEDADWMLFYDHIEGFTHEPGKSYQLKVNVDGVSDPPADGSSLRYRLIEIVSQKDAP